MRRQAIAWLGAIALSTFGLNYAVAQDKKAAKSAPKAAMKTIVENDRVKVYEVTYAPGAENTAIAASALRVVRGLSTGKLQRTYEDGKKEMSEWKTGQVKVVEAGPPYKTKNVGTTTVHLYVVQLK